MTNYRIVTKEGKIKFAGTGQDSWFTLQDAKEKAESGDRIYEYCFTTMERLWEVF